MSETILVKFYLEIFRAIKFMKMTMYMHFLDISQVTKGHTLLIPKRLLLIFLKLMLKQCNILVLPYLK